MAFSRWVDHMKLTRRRNSRGATLVEAAIVMIPLCLIIFGIIEFGFIFKDTLGISNATRTATRTAAAEPEVAPATFVTDVVASAKRAGSGVNINNGDKMCIYEVRPGGSPTINASGNISMSNCNSSHNAAQYVWASGNWSGPTAIPWAAYSSGAGPDTCLGDPQYDSIGIAMQVQHHSITGFFGSMTITEHSDMRLEPQTSDTNCTGS